MNPSRGGLDRYWATTTSAIIGVVEMTLRFEIFPDDLDATYLRITDRAR